MTTWIQGIFMFRILSKKRETYYKKHKQNSGHATIQYAKKT